VKKITLDTTTACELIDSLTQQMLDGLVWKAGKTTRDYLKDYRAQTQEEFEETRSTFCDHHADLLEKLLDAEDAEAKASAPEEDKSCLPTIKLTPRLFRALEWEAMMFDRTPEAQAIIHLAECVKDVTSDYFTDEKKALAWLKEGSPAEGVLEAYLEEYTRSREEVAS